MILHLALLLQTRTIMVRQEDRPAVRVSTQVFRLWNPASGEPLAVVSYIASVLPLTATERPIVMELTFSGDSKHPFARHDTSIVARLPFASRAPRMNGYILLPVDLAASSWTLKAEWPGLPDGQRWVERFEPLGRDTFALSDVVLGVEGEEVQGLVAAHVGTPVPRVLMKRAEFVAVYYQLKSDIARKDVLTTVRVMRVIGGKEQEEEMLRVGFRANVVPGVNEIQRDIDVSRLPGSRYYIDVTVSDSARHASVTRREVLDLVN